MRTYYRLTKPGIVYGNDISALGGLLLASSLRRGFLPASSLGLLLGMSLVIACGCVINNYIDRDIDTLMSRTQRRALVTAAVQPGHAIIFGFMLGLVGFIVLGTLTNWVTVVLGVIGLFFYLVAYSIFKRRGPSGTIVGSISGATPIAAGYTAVTGRFDIAALLLFIAMVCWQMPHFYAIAMYRHHDYKKAQLPVLPVARGMAVTRQYILVYIVGFTLASILLTVFRYTGFVYAAIMLGVGLAWLYNGWKHYRSEDAAWGRRMFFFSLISLLVFSTAISLGALLP